MINEIIMREIFISRIPYHIYIPFITAVDIMQSNCMLGPLKKDLELTLKRLSNLLKDLIMAVTSTFRTPLIGGVAIDTTSGRYLRFTLTGVGPQPLFTFSSADLGTLFKDTDFGANPLATYQWIHYGKPTDPKGLDVLVTTLSFLANASYDYKVEVCDATGVVSTVLDATYAGAPTDVETPSLTAVAK